MKKFKEWLNANKIIMLGAVVLGVAWVFVYSVAMAADSTPLWQNDIIRLHVLAHDETDDEMHIKMAIRDEVWGVVNELVQDADSVAQARFVITKNLPKIESTARNAAAAHGADHTISASLERDLNFPATNYAGIIFPRGRYEALQIVVGDGGGGNWWCVMFPPMCLMDISRAAIIETDDDGITTRPRFRVIEIMQNLF